MMWWVHGRKLFAWSWVHPLDKSHCESTSFWVLSRWLLVTIGFESSLRIPASKLLDAKSVKELLPDVGLSAVEIMNMHHEVLLPPNISNSKDVLAIRLEPPNHKPLTCSLFQVTGSTPHFWCVLVAMADSDVEEVTPTTVLRIPVTWHVTIIMSRLG